MGFQVYLLQEVIVSGVLYWKSKAGGCSDRESYEGRAMSLSSGELCLLRRAHASTHGGERTQSAWQEIGYMTCQSKWLDPSHLCT